MVTSSEMVKACLVTTLNASLRFQGILDVVVCGLSDDFGVAMVKHVRDGKIVSIGAVQTEILLEDI